MAVRFGFAGYTLHEVGGDWGMFATRPLSASQLAPSALMVVIVLLPAFKSKPERAFVGAT
jgi:hypothetical protein